VRGQQGPKYIRGGVLLYYHRTTQFYYIITEQHNFSLAVKMCGFVLFLKDVSKYTFSFSPSRTVRLGTVC
jgi:hypothetical protein